MLEVVVGRIGIIIRHKDSPNEDYIAIYGNRDKLQMEIDNAKNDDYEMYIFYDSGAGVTNIETGSNRLCTNNIRLIAALNENISSFISLIDNNETNSEQFLELFNTFMRYAELFGGNATKLISYVHNVLDNIDPYTQCKSAMKK